MTKLAHGAAVLCLLAAATSAGAGDWPTHRHDSQRSGVTADVLSLPLVPTWVYRSPRAPEPAWTGPARADYYTSSQVPLKPRLAFDRAFGVAVAGDALYFGSSADHSVTSLNAGNGAPRWSFTTDGPVRMAPAVALGNVYAGSDDGAVYCMEAASGSRRWQYTPAGEENYLVPSNGHFVSPWPVRSGVIVEDGIAYLSAGFLPAEGVYVCALDAATGADSGPGLWKRRRLNDVSLQGYILASATRLYLPAGRSSPYAISRSNGNLLGQFYSGSGGSRGTFALLSGNSLITGPASRGGAFLEEWDASQPGRDSLAVYDGGNSMVVSGSTSYLLSDTALMAIDRGTHAVRWRRDVSYPYSLILAGGVLFAGGTNEVAAFDATSGATLWTGAVTGKAYDLAVAAGKLFASTDRGAIHAFGPAVGTNATFIRGDANGDGLVDTSDPLAILFRLFRQSPVVACEDHGDADDNGRLEITDSLYLLNFLFLNGRPPAAPFPAPGFDRTADVFPCGEE